MDLTKMIAELHEERTRIDQAVATLEVLAAGRGKRRGRPPAWMSTLNGKHHGRPKGSRNKAKIDATPGE